MHLNALSPFVSLLAIVTNLPSSTAQLANVTTSTSLSNSASTFGCPLISPGPVSTSFLATSLPAPILTDATTIETIRQTLALYPLAIDGLNFPVLRRIFTPDARANYSDPIGVLNGVEAIIATLPAGLTLFASTQHMYGTQYIDVCSLNSAVSVTYFQATHFFTPYAGVTSPVDGSLVLVDRGMYQDTWARQRDGTWKITNRNLVRMGPPVVDGGLFPSV